jgi:hypothetical protein
MEWRTEFSRPADERRRGRTDALLFFSLSAQTKTAGEMRFLFSFLVGVDFMGFIQLS